MSNWPLPHSEQEFVGSGATARVLCADCGDPFPCQVYRDALARRNPLLELLQPAPDDILRTIITDLIEDLRELATCDIDLGNQTDPETIAFLLDRAEARLKGL